ncbi:MAG: NAD+ synthase [Actinobacteria bacterium]|uniref:NAD(+) synthase (glutamine-hydrolyzing) n=1 Tax=freshwater metagenome TaxID=449393 RepID=A0A6J6NJF7_9ZZZZ|nr:NAD+ synthase [Actinomycetota bacterium]
MRVALAQLNSVVGDLTGNRDRIVARLAEARAAGADLVIFPELAVTGYPPEDLLHRPAFVRAARSVIDELLPHTRGLTALVGAPEQDGTHLYNAAWIITDMALQGTYRKQLLPNYGVFDEERWFQSGSALVLLEAGGAIVAPTICEDIWFPEPTISGLAAGGARLIANLSASPFHVGKDREREEMLQARARDNGCVVALCNMVGGQDELVFDGHSVVIDADGSVIARAPGFEEALLVVDVDVPASNPALPTLGLGEPALHNDRLRPAPAPQLDDLEQMRQALELGLHDYIEKGGFDDVVIGLSGGIDSALTAALCVGALGAGRVHGVSMPSRYSSDATRSDARVVAESLGIDFREIPIEPLVEAFDAALAPSFAGRPADLTEENIQARARGTLLMGLSNKFGWIVVATGNKSEMSVGYSTLYGDLVGGFALLKDVFKTDVFRLARHLNERAGRELIPQSTIDRPPSAELRADQRDDDSLPPYDKLDAVLEAYVEGDRSRDELIADGFEQSVVDRALGLVDRAEYKRRQAPPGVKLRTKAFGRDRRTPITNRWRG